MATRWGIVSARKICLDFANAVSSLPTDDHIVTAAAAKIPKRGEIIKDKYDVPNVYSTFEEMAAADTYDVAFISVVLPNHLAVARLFIEAGKAVLLQRPMGLNPAMVKEIIDLMYARLGAWGRRLSQRTTRSDSDIIGMRGGSRRRGIVLGTYDGTEVDQEWLVKYRGKSRPRPS